MRIVSDNDTRTFTDPAGDTLMLLTIVRQRDAERAAKMETEEAMEALRELGLSMEDAIRQAQESTDEERAAARERMGTQPKSLTVRRFRLSAVAKGLCVGGQTYAYNTILEAYDNMDAESAAWVDAQVDAAWAGANPGDAERES